MISGRLAGWLTMLAVLAGCHAATRQPAPERKQRLVLLTGLPIVWGERFGLDRPASPLRDRLESEFELSLADGIARLPDQALMLAAQPRALPAEQLVALDAWVRRGGRLLLLADPLLEWPSERPLGDPLRPPPAFADTGLLGHWGLRLDVPERPGPREDRLAGRTVRSVSPGTLVRLGGACQVENNELVARCRIGRGRVTVVADADFLNAADQAGAEAILAELHQL